MGYITDQAISSGHVCCDKCDVLMALKIGGWYMYTNPQVGLLSLTPFSWLRDTKYIGDIKYHNKSDDPWFRSSDQTTALDRYIFSWDID